MSLSSYRHGTHRGYSDWYCSPYADIPDDDAADHHGRAKLAGHMLKARAQLPWDGSPRGVHVVLSNEKRKLINRRCSELRRRERPNSVYVESSDAGNGGEPSFHCYPGQQL